MQNINHIIHSLSKPKVDRIHMACNMISSVSSYEEIQKIVDQMPSIHKGLFKFSYLKRKSYSHFNQVGYPIQSKSMFPYIWFITYIVEQYSNEICNYLGLRKEYEENVLNGHYESARKNIRDINETIGYSYWGMEQTIKLERWAKDVNSSSQLSQKIIQENQKLSIFCNFYFNTSSVDFASDDVKQIMHNLLSQMLKNDESFFQYFASLTIPYEWSFSGINWLQYYTQLSIVDLYNSLRDNIWKFDPQYLIGDFWKCINLIVKLTKDPYLIKYLQIHNIECSEHISNEEREAIVKLFCTQKYNGVIDMGETYLSKNPTDFEIMDYVTKSYILTGKEYQLKGGHTNTIINQIRDNYYIYLTHNDQYKLAYKKLRTICIAMYSFHSCRYLLNILEEMENAQFADIYNQSYEYTPFLSPYDLRIEKKRSHIFLEDYDDYSSAEVSKAAYDTRYEVPALFMNDSLITHLSVNDMKSILNKVTPYMRDCVASTIFSLLIEKKMWKDAVLFYVDQKLTYTNIDIKYDKNKLEKIFQDNVVGDMQIPLEMSIFYTMIDANAGTRFLSYKHYLKERGVCCASEIIRIDSPKVYYFLKYVADIHVLELHALQFSTFDQVINERVNICNNLYGISNDKEMAREVANHVKTQEIKKLISTIDESKIFVDEEGLKKSGLEDEQTIFGLYKSMDSNVQVPDSMLDFYQQIIKGLERSKQSKLKNVDFDSSNVNYKELLYEQLYRSIRQKFLLDPKYGLDFFLSTRIRHGTLVNQLRKHFEENNLVTNLIDTNQYADNTVWVDEECHLSGEEKKQMILEFDNFTREVDQIILSIKNELIQIKYDEYNSDKIDALDYSINDDIKKYLDKYSKESAEIDFESCIDRMFQLLWYQTESNLLQVKKKLEKKHQDLKNALTHLAQHVHTNVKGIYKSKLIEAIAQCSTSLQNDFGIVEKWLQRRDLKDFEYQYQKVWDTCMAIMSNMNMNLPICKTNIQSNTVFKGKSFNYLYDITHELLNNVCNYQQHSHESIECEIKVNEESNVLHIQISNSIFPEDIPKIETKIKEKSMREMIPTNVTREGESGMLKIRNIVFYSLRNEHNSYENYIEGNHFISDVKVNIKDLV